jgi:hypothetical protein
MFTVRMVDSQEGQQVALPTWLVHDPPQDRIRVNRLKACASSLKWRELLLGEADVLCHAMRGGGSMKFG